MENMHKVNERIRKLELELKNSVPNSSFNFAKRWGFAGIIAAIFSIFGGIPIAYDLGIRRAADIAHQTAMEVLYRPVGNGGAIQEFFQGPTPERREMYDQIYRFNKEAILRQCYQH